MYEQESLPQARKEDLIEDAVGEELLLYDQNSHIAHCLSPLPACVWRHCDGERDVTELAELAGTSESLVADTLHELREKDLLVAEPALTQSAIPGESRREVIGRVARYGAAAAGASMIVSATAATPAMAASATCCQCEKSGGGKCDCKICVGKKDCEEFCEKSAKCDATTQGFLTGTKCEATGACTG